MEVLTADRHGFESIVVTGLDKDNTDFLKTVEALRSAFGEACVPIAFPGDDKKSVAGVFSDDVPAAYKDAAEEARGLLEERAAESSDELTEKFLMGEKLTQEEINHGLDVAATKGLFIRLIPVFP